MVTAAREVSEDRTVSFGPFSLTSSSLYKDGDLVAISPKPMALLNVLVRRGGDVVSREELLGLIWGANGSDESLTRCVYLTRLALDDVGPERPRYIEAVYGVGYRFLKPG
jgi:DNA-binding winged helix-turn-helix (wHTH) protein